MPTTEIYDTVIALFHKSRRADYAGRPQEGPYVQRLAVRLFRQMSRGGGHCLPPAIDAETTDREREVITDMAQFMTAVARVENRIRSARKIAHPTLVRFVHD